MRFPAFGRALWHRRISGEQPRIACLLVGGYWRRPYWIPEDIPLLAVKTEPWHLRSSSLYWRVVSDMTVLAVDARREHEVETGPEDWDAWFWLLADVQRYAPRVLMFTPTIEFNDPPDRMAFERDLNVFAYCSCSLDRANGRWRWPPWWPYGDRLEERAA